MATVPLEIRGVCGDTVQLTIQRVTFSFTCLPGEHGGPVLDPGEFGGGHTALALGPETLELLAAVDVLPDADPYVIPVEPGADLALSDLAESLDEARATGRPIRLEIRSEYELTGE